MICLLSESMFNRDFLCIFPSISYQWLSVVVPNYSFLSFSVNFGFLACGMHYGWATSSIPLLTGGNYSFQITDNEGSWLISMMPVGSFFGDIIAAILVDVIGRKNLILFSTLPLALSWIVISLAPAAIYMFLGRFIAGIADGIAFTSIPSYLAEISDPEIRGLLCSTYPVTLFIGMLFMNVLQFFFSMNDSCYVAAGVILSSYIIIPWIPESPYFFLMKNNEKDAISSLQKFTGRKDVEEDVKRIIKGLEEEQINKGGFRDLFNNSMNLRTLVICLFLCASQQLSGITAIMSYSTQVFEQSKDIMDPTAANLVFFGVILIGSLLALLLVDHSGRKILLIISSALTTICLFVNGVYLAIYSGGGQEIQAIPITTTVVYAFVFSAGMNTIPMMVVTEILPSQVKGAGLCVTNFTFSLVSTLTVKYFSWSSDNFGLWVPFFTFGLFSILTLLFVVLFVPETRDKTLEEIQNAMRSGKKIEDSYE